MAQSVNFDRIADRYDETRGGLERGISVAAALAPYLPNGPLLEIGVGTGLIASALTARGWSVTGIDLSEAMLARASQRVPGRVARADAAALPLADGSVAGCVAVHVLHLVGDVAAVLGEVARVLRPGGRLAVVGAGEATDTTDISAVVHAMDARLTDGAPRRDAPETVIRLAAAVGMRPVADFSVVRSRGSISPAAVVDQITARTWSRLWDLPAARWNAIVEPALDALRSLPNPSQPRVADMRVPALVFQAA